MLDKDRINWEPVSGSSRVIAEAYDEATETILVKFTDGATYYYSNCPPHIWRQFTAPGQSRGKYINEVLNFKTRGRL